MKTQNNKHFIFTCDVEYSGSGTEKGTYKILELLNRYNIKGTFFVTYRVLTEYPQLVRDISDSEHEIASHGYSHPYIERNYKYLFDLSEKETEKEISYSYHRFLDKGYKVKGFRAPAFKTNNYVLDCVKQWFEYDSSSLNTLLRVGRYTGIYDRVSSDIDFTYIPVSSLGRLKIPFGSPYFMAFGSGIRWLLRKTLSDCDNVVFYCHCFDMIRPDSELLSARSFIRRFIYYNNCGSRRALDFFHTMLSTVNELGFQFTTCEQLCRIAAHINK